jgi:hypothetical protein
MKRVLSTKLTAKIIHPFSCQKKSIPIGSESGMNH